MESISLRLVVVSLCILSVSSIGIFVYLKNKKHDLNKYFLLYNLALGFWNVGDIFSVLFRSNPPLALYADRVPYIGGVFFIYFTVHFYSHLSKGEKPGIFASVILKSLTPILSVLVLTPFIIKDVSFEGGFAEHPGSLFWIFGTYLIWGISYGIYHLINVYNNAISQKRLQIQYVLISLSLLTAGLLSYSFWFFLSDSLPLYYIFEIAYSISIAYAIVRHGLLDIRTVIHKTILWFLTFSVVVIPVILSFLFFRSLLSQSTGVDIGLLIAVVLVVLVYARHFQPKVDHLFQRRKYNTQKILENLVKDLVLLKDVQGFTDKIQTTIREAVYVSHSSSILLNGRTKEYFVVGRAPLEEDINHYLTFLNWMKTNDKIIESDQMEIYLCSLEIKKVARKYFKAFSAKVVLPLIHHETLIGLVNIGEKDSLKPFNSLDIDFFENLRGQATIALSNSLLYDDVRKMSEKLRYWADELEHKVEVRTEELAKSKEQLEQSYQKLQELDALKSRFFANISHEFRTPLTLMLVPIDTVRQQKITDPKQIRRQLDMAYNNGLRLLKLINNLLDLAKIDSGKMELKCRPVHIAPFLRRMVGEISQVAEQKGIILSLSVQDLSLVVSLDQEKIERVILNLLFNAIKFTPSGGKVSVSCQKEGEQLCISVSDNGAGIPAEMRQKVFDRFFQVDGASTRSHEGTGIGLAVAKELVELHGGTITVKNAPNQGSTFSLTLPFREATDPVETGSEWGIPEGFQSFSREAAYNTADIIATSDHPDPTSSNKGRPKILVVEDNTDMRRFLSVTLGEYYEVLTAVDGEEGVKLAKQTLPDLIVSDVMMPKQDGFQLCRELKNDPMTAYLPVMLLTAKADISSKMEGFGVKADDYLVKPFNAEELLARVRTQIERRNSVKTLEEFLKTAQHQVQEANLLMIEMAHEIKNPVSFAKGNISLLSRTVKQAEQSGEWQETFEEMRDSIQIIGAGLDRVSAIVGNVKQFLSPNLDNKTSFSLTDTMKSTVNILSSQLEGKVKIHQEYKTNGVIEGAADQIHQVFLNLIKNAVEAMNGAGELKILITEEEGRFIVTIQDNGSGIPPEILPHLFDPFFTTKKERGGNGLGLSICKKIVYRHNGEIELRNIQGLGTEAKIFFPKTHKQ